MEHAFHYPFLKVLVGIKVKDLARHIREKL